MIVNTQLRPALERLIDHLETRSRAGETRVTLSEAPLRQLQSLPSLMLRQASQTASSPPPGHLANPTPAPTSQASDSAATPSAPATGGSTSRVSDLVPAEGEKRDKLNHLARLAKRCTDCRSLGTLRETMVFATGNPDAELMFVGEAPGHDEEKQKKPFVGPAGQLLDKIIGAMGLEREQVYISNIVKFRPIKGNPNAQGTNNRKPTEEEMAASVKYVLAEIDVVQPKLIVALGGTAAQGLLGLTGSVGSARGHFHDLNGTPVAVTYHPSYVLHRKREGEAAMNEAKRLVWEDMKRVMAHLGLSGKST